MRPNAFVLSIVVYFCVHALPAVESGSNTDESDDSGLPAPELTELWSPDPPVISAPPGGFPSDAIVLFNGTTLDAWESVKNPGEAAPWRMEGEAMVVAPRSGHIRTKAAFGDIQLHLEFRTPARVRGEGQERGNSGVFFMGLYEVQILDSFDNKTYVNGQMAAIYKQHVPLVNAARPPGEWQSLDVVWIAPRFAADGALLSPARITVFHNGVLVQNSVELMGPTVYRGLPAYKPHDAKLPLMLQDHHKLVAFRNIWIRELAYPVPRGTGEPVHEPARPGATISNPH